MAHTTGRQACWASEIESKLEDWVTVVLFVAEEWHSAKKKREKRKIRPPPSERVRGTERRRKAQSCDSREGFDFKYEFSSNNNVI